MYFNLLDKQGFLHVKNILTEKTISKIYKYVSNIDFNYKIKIDKINLKQKKKINSLPMNISLQTFLDGHNINLKQYNRKVYQLWLPQFRNFNSHQIYYFDDDKNIGSLIYQKNMNYIKSFRIDNENFMNYFILQIYLIFLKIIILWVLNILLMNQTATNKIYILMMTKKVFL